MGFVYSDPVYSIVSFGIPSVVVVLASHKANSNAPVRGGVQSHASGLGNEP
jgi:hypothetical protein